ncbi:MAG: OmpH family outer membrane protein, partial [Prevotellaceae bacterium]|nr:OmpH family outer membrane protein [Prevotellaceae bacterium]
GRDLVFPGTENETDIGSGISISGANTSGTSRGNAFYSGNTFEALPDAYDQKNLQNEMLLGKRNVGSVKYGNELAVTGDEIFDTKYANIYKSTTFTTGRLDRGFTPGQSDETLLQNGYEAKGGYQVMKELGEKNGLNLSDYISEDLWNKIGNNAGEISSSEVAKFNSQYDKFVGDVREKQKNEIEKEMNVSGESNLATNIPGNVSGDSDNAGNIIGAGVDMAGIPVINGDTPRLFDLPTLETHDYIDNITTGEIEREMNKVLKERAQLEVFEKTLPYDYKDKINQANEKLNDLYQKWRGATAKRIQGTGDDYERKLKEYQDNLEKCTDQFCRNDQQKKIYEMTQKIKNVETQFEELLNKEFKRERRIIQEELQKPYADQQAEIAMEMIKHGDREAGLDLLEKHATTIAIRDAIRDIDPDALIDAYELFGGIIAESVGERIGTAAGTVAGAAIGKTPVAAKIGGVAGGIVGGAAASAFVSTTAQLAREIRKSNEEVNINTLNVSEEIAKNILIAGLSNLSGKYGKILGAASNGATATSIGLNLLKGSEKSEEKIQSSSSDDPERKSQMKSIPQPSPWNKTKENE